MPEWDGPWGGLEPPKPPTQPPITHWSQDRRFRLAIILGFAVVLGFGLWGLMQLFPGKVSGRDDWSTIAYQLGFAGMIAVSLFSRRPKFGETARYVAIWAAVMAILALGYAYRTDIADAALRLRAGLIPSYAQKTGPHDLVLGQDASGGYSVIGEVNGQKINFAVDTGASDIVLSPADAQRLGVDMTHLDFARQFETANGVGQGAGYTVSTLVVGPIRFTNVPVSINRAPMSTSLLGMEFLKRLKSVEAKDGRLYLRGPG